MECVHVDGKRFEQENLVFDVEHCIRFNLNKSAIKLNDMQFDTEKLTFLFKSLPIDKNTLHKPWVPLINGIFDYILLSCRIRRRRLNCIICLEVKNKLQLWSGGAKTVYGLGGNHLHYSVANLFRLTRAKFYTNRFSFEEDMAKNILVCFFMEQGVYIYIYTHRVP